MKKFGFSSDTNPDQIAWIASCVHQIEALSFVWGMQLPADGLKVLSTAISNRATAVS